VTLDSNPKTGSLLVASPTLLDRHFSRTVVLVCAHSIEGSMGLVLNRPSSFALSDVLVGVPPAASEKVFWGGPVEQNRFIVLQRSAEANLPGPPIAKGIQFGREEDFMHDLLQGAPGAFIQYRMFAGYAGWGEDQLQMEMDQCSWLIAPTDVSLVFDTPADSMWAVAIQSLGPEFAHLASMPMDPRVN
jgi:putative transcriptional regulator